MNARDEPKASPCQFCGEKFTAAGIANHERYCDENPHPGISPKQQQELGLLEEETGDTDTGTNPDQEVKASAPGLPPRSSVEAANKVSQKVRADGSGESVECPVCESDHTLEAKDARQEYEEQEEQPVAGVVLAFKLAARYCEECFTIWGDEFNEPVGLDEAVGAVGGGEA